MTVYSCPMHPEIQRNKPGRCPLCGMELTEKTSLKSYLPLIAIIGLIFIFAVVRSPDIITNFMAGFFIVFAGFKLLDLRGFAQGYSTYDLLAQRWYFYGYLYPFIELFFGLVMFFYIQSPLVLLAELFLMLFSGLGVAIKLAKHQKFECVCLGTFLKVPLTKVTLVEDFGMAILAGFLLLKDIFNY